MTENNNSLETDLEMPADLPLKSEEIGYKPDELTACPACSRRNPPTKISCFYCGAKLPLAARLPEGRSWSFKPLEPWERGWNIIASDGADGACSAAAARILSADSVEIADKLAAGVPVPLVRVESAEVAKMLCGKLNEAGVQASVCSDDDLAADVPPGRLRSIEISDDRLRLMPFNGGPQIEVQIKDIVLIVAGTFVEQRIDASSVRKKKQNVPDDEAFSLSDELLIDIYSSDSAHGWRVREKGFDFSCLGAGKTLLASANMRLLKEALLNACTSAKFSDDYDRVRGFLDFVWEPESRRESMGIKRALFGTMNIKTARFESNLEQFTKYSRMLRSLL